MLHVLSHAHLGTLTWYRFCKYSFFPRTLLEWNKLPRQVVITESLELFTGTISTFLTYYLWLVEHLRQSLIFSIEWGLKVNYKIYRLSCRSPNNFTKSIHVPSPHDILIKLTFLFFLFCKHNTHFVFRSYQSSHLRPKVLMVVLCQYSPVDITFN